MTTPPGAGAGGPSSVELFAEDIEKSFNETRLTLTDDDTAAAFLRTLDIWARVLEGSHAQGIITGEQLDELLSVLIGMRQAPGLV
jgi:hypothetical protein